MCCLPSHNCVHVFGTKPNQTSCIDPMLLCDDSIRAGGVGVNLQAADTVIIFDTDWNPQAIYKITIF